MAKDFISAVSPVVEWLQGRYRTGSLRFTRWQLADFLEQNGFSRDWESSMGIHLKNENLIQDEATPESIPPARRADFWNAGIHRRKRPLSAAFPMMKVYECLPEVLAYKPPTTGKPTARRKTCGEQMAQIVHDGNLVVLDWTSAQWAAHLGCDESTVRHTDTWKALDAERESIRQSSAPEKQRRQASVKK